MTTSVPMAWPNLFDENMQLQTQLAEARAENGELRYQITELTNRVAIAQGSYAHVKTEARQEAARECSKIVHNLGCTYALGTAERGLLVYTADLLLQKLGLEG